jgi:hypothetical protein
MFFGIGAAQLPVTWNRVVVAITGACFVGYGVWENARIAWPESHGAAVYANESHHLKQTTHYTCGPAACVAALSYFEIEKTERELATLCLTHKNGSRMFNLYRGLRLALPESEFDVRMSDLSASEVMREDQVRVGDSIQRVRVE